MHLCGLMCLSTLCRRQLQVDKNLMEKSDGGGAAAGARKMGIAATPLVSRMLPQKYPDGKWFNHALFSLIRRNQRLHADSALKVS